MAGWCANVAPSGGRRRRRWPPSGWPGMKSNRRSSIGSRTGVKTPPGAACSSKKTWWPARPGPSPWSSAPPSSKKRCGAAWPAWPEPRKSSWSPMARCGSGGCSRIAFATATKTLDFYHASEHLWALARHLHPGPGEAAQWVEPLLHQLRHSVEHRLIESLEKLLPADTPGSPPSDPLVEREVEYFRHHRDHLQYASLAARGAPIGSGAMESACSQFQNRFKRRGQFWTRQGLRHLLAIDVAVKNGSLTHLWN